MARRQGRAAGGRPDCFDFRFETSNPRFITSLPDLRRLPPAPAVCPLPVTVFLPVERFALGLRAHVEDVDGAAGAALAGRVVGREDAPVALARDGVYGYLAQVDFLLRDDAGVLRRRAPDAVESRARNSADRARARHDINAVHERLQVGRVVVWVIDAEDRAVGDADAAARVNVA